MLVKLIYQMAKTVFLNAYFTFLQMKIADLWTRDFEFVLDRPEELTSPPSIPVEFFMRF